MHALLAGRSKVTNLRQLAGNFTSHKCCWSCLATIIAVGGKLRSRNRGGRWMLLRPTTWDALLVPEVASEGCEVHWSSDMRNLSLARQSRANLLSQPVLEQRTHVLGRQTSWDRRAFSVAHLPRQMRDVTSLRVASLRVSPMLACFRVHGVEPRRRPVADRYMFFWWCGHSSG